MTDIDTTRYREAAEEDRYCDEPGCTIGSCWSAGAIGSLCDEIDRLRAIMQLAIDHINDDDNQDEMSSDAQEWCGEVTEILNGAF